MRMVKSSNYVKEDWKLVKLGECVDVLDNLRKPINSDERQKRIIGKKEKELFPYYGATGQVGLIDDYLTDGEYILVGEDGAPFLDLYKNKAYKIKGKTWVNNHAHILKGKDGITINEYVLHYLNSIDYRNHVNGTTRLKLTKGSLIDIPFILPPIDIQKAIVSKIEELFSELDKGIENLKLAQQQLKVYRQSVLKWAFEGRLTNENVKEGELPEGWHFEELANLSKIVSGFAFKSTDFLSQGVPVVKISNVGYSEFLWKDQQYLPNKFLNSNPEFIVRGGDILIALTRPITNNITKVCQFPINSVNALLNQRVANIKDLKLNALYLYSYFQTDAFKNYIRSKFSETLQPNLSPKDLAVSLIPVCSNEEQERVVQEIQSKLSIADKMEESINQSLQQAEVMRLSVLKWTFGVNII